MPYYCQLFSEKIVNYRPSIEVLETKKLATFQDLEDYTFAINQNPMRFPKTVDAHLMITNRYQLVQHNQPLQAGFRIVHVLTGPISDMRYQLECFRLLDNAPHSN
ncbi:hypothetical protein K5F93_17725 [Pseudomonas protegens]|uniref:hypothetical protein n=1 Tax=Pseudomonas protegens TaxID=380021 RepID=UPI001C8DFFFB|nr:hypothetical protein [Pseudomonas protegens]QZI68266.1 hypothetical protein K5F93_17725 [Pseudomonas protegens]